MGRGSSSDYADYLADFHAESTIYAEPGARGLSLADGLQSLAKAWTEVALRSGSAGIVYPSSRTKRELHRLLRPSSSAMPPRARFTDHIRDCYAFAQHPPRHPDGLGVAALSAA